MTKNEAVQVNQVYLIFNHPLFLVDSNDKMYLSFKEYRIFALINEAMKYIVFYILFFFAVIHGLNVAVPHCAPEIKKTEATDRLTATAHLNAIISVLLDSNSFADLSARQVNSITSNVARRYRPGEFLCDKIFSYLSVGQGMTIGQLLKKSSLSSQECAALQKNGGYYIYTLRRIII